MGARGPPGTPGDVSKTSAVSRVHGNTAHGHRQAIYEITMMEEIVVILLHCIFYCLFFFLHRWQMSFLSLVNL